MMPKTIRLITGLWLAGGFLVASQPALAWGDREQGILAGIAGTVLWNKLNERGEPSPAAHPMPHYRHGYHAPRLAHYKAPVVVYAAPGHCREVPVKDADGQIIEIRRLCER
jgi:hypothetical protein